jgi:predicted dehydrogenase
MTTFAMVGFGYRAAAFWRVAQGLSGVTCVGAVVRSPRKLPLPQFVSLDECLAAARPDFLVAAVPRAANPDVIRAAVARGVPIMAETPPAPDRPELAALCRDAAARELVQVAEQYLLMPSHAARLAAVRAGLIGTPTQVQVSSTHQYHAVSLIRGLLGVGGDVATVRAGRTVAPLVDPQNRQGWTDDPEPKPATTTIATIDFGGGRSGLYDFTTNQSRNLLRFRRMVVRGTHGELRDDEIVRLAGPRSIVRTPLVRRQTGHDLDLDGFDTQTITYGDRVLYRNPFRGSRWNDDEIATASLLTAMAAWVRGDGPAPYPLIEGARDQQIALAVEESADLDATVIAGPLG